MNNRAKALGFARIGLNSAKLTGLVGALVAIACGDGERGATSNVGSGGRSDGSGGSTQSAGMGRSGHAGWSSAGRSSAGHAGWAENGGSSNGGVFGGSSSTGSTSGGSGGSAGTAQAGTPIGGASQGGTSPGAGTSGKSGTSNGGIAGSSPTKGGQAGGNLGGGEAGANAMGGTMGSGNAAGALAVGGATNGGAAGDAGYGGVPNAMESCTGHYQMESLDRGLVAVAVKGGVYVGWRMSGCEYDSVDPSKISYNLYRDGALLASVTDSTNYLDDVGMSTSTYTVRAVVDGAERSDSEIASVWSANYVTIPISPPTGGTVDRVAAGQTDATYSYSANDGSPGDLDGDGRYEIVLKWDPTNSRDNSLNGFTGNVVFDAYRLDGTRLWRIDLGRNIRAGAHYTQFVVYDFDGNGRAEVAMKTAPGTRDGLGQYLRTGPAATDDDSADYRNVNGMVLSGNEYLTIFDGRTGAELATTYFVVDRGFVSDWGDTSGNRVDRFLASAGFVSDLGLGQSASGRPSILMARGYYTRATISAWNWRAGTLSRFWLSDSYPSMSPTNSAYGQGAHSMAVADVDFDGAQEILYGSATIDSTGVFKCSTGFGHGDALHVSDFVPTRAGLEVMMPHESTTGPSYSLRDGSNCGVLLQGPVRGVDTGRGVAGDVDAGNAGAELWAGGSALVSATSGLSVGAAPSSSNFLIWWDADESRELLDDTAISKYGSGLLFRCTECASNNGTKATPVLTADLFGDWREEVVWRTTDNTALRLYTTTAVTARRIYTLMHDPQYRMQVTSEQTAYNQPPHPSFHIGSGMAPPPKPDIAVK